MLHGERPRAGPRPVLHSRVPLQFGWLGCHGAHAGRWHARRAGLAEWRAWIGSDKERAAEDPARASAVAERAGRVDLGQIEIAEMHIPELYDAPLAEASPADLAPLEPEQLARLTVRLVKPAGWKEVWTSKGTGGARASGGG